MWHKVNENFVESDEGYSVQILGRGGIKYVEKAKAFYIDSALLVDSARIVGTEFLGGSYGMLVYKRRIRNWESPVGSFEPVDDETRDRIVENIRLALLCLGYRVNIEES